MKCDSQWQNDGLAELKWRPSIDAAHIGVAASRGAKSVMSARREGVIYEEK